MQNFKKYLSLVAFYFVPVTLIVSSWFAGQGGLSRENDFYSAFGSIAMVLVSLIVFVKPLSQIFAWKGFKYAVAFRRQLGVASFWFALFHGMLYVRLYDLFGIESFIGRENTFYLLGLVGLIGMILLGVTSNNYSVKYLGKYWKKLHRFVYVIFFVILVHAGQAEGHYLFAAALGLAFIALKLYAWKISRRKVV
jgi:DMSO/TMAO reductase YedYZ heme-binding membrane subunit